ENDQGPNTPKNVQAPMTNGSLSRLVIQQGGLVIGIRSFLGFGYLDIGIYHMSAATHSEEQEILMGIPLPNGKLAMWLFLVTEIMFFTALLGTYMILRNGQPTTKNPWPTPHDVHLQEAIGAFNTFVLILSSFFVVLAHHYLHHGDAKRAVKYIAGALA